MESRPGLGSAGVRPPRQERSRRTLERILVAARELMAIEGPDGVTVQAVVGRAGASVGSFYARFAGKDELLDHLEEVVRGEASARWREALASVPWETLSLEASVEALVGLVIDSRQMAGKERAALRKRPGGTQREMESSLRIREDVRDTLLPHRDAIRHPDPRLAIDIGLRAVVGVLRDLEDGERLVERPEGASEPVRLHHELTRLYLAYLGAFSQRGAPDGPDGMDFFDVWA